MKLELVKQRKYVIFFFTILGVCQFCSMIETYLKNDEIEEGGIGDRLNQRKLFKQSATRKALQNVLFNPKDRLRHHENTFQQVVSILRTQSP